MRAGRGWRALVQLVVVVAAEAAAAVALHRLGAVPFLQIGWADPVAWLRATPPEDVLLAVCRLGALACAYWLLGGTLLYTLARASRIPAAVRAVEWAALPAVRRLADRAIAVALATSSVMSGTGGIALADAPRPPDPPPVVEVVPAPPVDDLYRPTPAGVPEAVGVAMPTPVIVQQPTEQVHVVTPGEDLWTIAEARIARDLMVPPDMLSPEEVVGYWREVVDANRASLDSGDPDVLRPGEVVILPPR